MNKKILTAAILLLHISAAFSQTNKKSQDQEAIKSMCGCYEVGFNFAETFQHTDDSTYTPSKKKQTSALEWAKLIKDEDDKIMIQHLLIVGSPEKQMIIKHWRQDWLFENTEFYMYNGDNNWTYTTKSDEEVQGQWTQKVYQVDDSPRYEGSSSWVHVDGKSYWENKTDAPLPRREYTQRSDYNITVRRNRHELTPEGWIHAQNNDKVLRVEGEVDELIAQEVGYNTYTKVDDSKCKTAQDWWTENQDFWAEARTAWEAVYGADKDLTLAEKVEGKRLYEELFGNKLDTKSKKIKKTIFSFVK